jgi:hypothetical protein
MFTVEKSQVASVSDASRILLHYLIHRLLRLLNDPPDPNAGGSFTLAQLSRLLLLAIQGLCQGRSTMQSADRLALTSDKKCN